jgi:hypothetical protein
LANSAHVRILHGERAFAVFAFLALLHPAAEEVREQLHAEADAEHRQPSLKMPGSAAARPWHKH